MPTIILNQTACNQGLDTTRVEVTTSNSLIFENAVAPELVGSGVKITQIVIKGYARNSNSVYKYLKLGFKPAIDSGRSTWSTYNGENVVGDKFTAVKNSTSGSYIYNTITRTYNETTNADTFALFAGHIKESFDNGTPVYLGIIQPNEDYSTQTYVKDYWKIEITYELLGNIPTTNVNNVALGSAISTSIQTVLEGSTTTLRYKMGDTVLSTNENLEADVIDVYVVPMSAGQHFPNDLTGTLTVEAETFVDGVSYGVVATGVTVELPNDAAPICDCEATRIWADEIETSAQIDAYVQNKSGANFNMNGSAKYGASISGYELTIEGITYDANPATHAIISGSGDVNYSYTVTDSRGLSRTYTDVLNVLPLEAPQIQDFSVLRVTEDGAEAIDGTFAMATLNANVSSLMVNGVEKNTITYHVEYREIATEGETEKEWISTDEYTVSSASISRSAMLTSGGTHVGGGGADESGNNLPFNDMVGYEFRVVVSDLYGSSQMIDGIPTKEQLIDINEVSGQIGFGGDAPNADETVGYRFHKHVNFAQGATGINLSEIGIQSGSVPQITSLEANTVEDVEIVFPIAYADGTTPNVVVGFVSGSSAGGFGKCCIAATNITNTGFTIRVFNGDSSKRSPNASWIAIGVPVV